jgi:hypothetical protein
MNWKIMPMTKIHKKRVNMNNLLDKIKEISNQFGFDWRVIAAFIEVETGGKGFNSDGKIMIQFEPSWFKRYVPNAPAGIWSTNKVDVQSKEWEAFNNAFAINKEAAMLSTSIGLGQIMGFHYKRLGYKTVGEMWDDAKKGIDRQIWQICEFIRTDNKLKDAIKRKDWHMIATIYNGANYLQLAKKLDREPYNISLEKAYKKYLKYGN